MTLIDVDASANAVTAVVGAVMLVVWPSWSLVTSRPRRKAPRPRHARHGASRWRTAAVVAAVAATVGACGGAGVALRADTPYERCLNALRAEYDLWVQDATHEVDPPECDQPRVTYAEYARAWRAAGGGDVWVAPAT